MKIEKAIEKAIENGYKPFPEGVELAHLCNKTLPELLAKENFILPKILLDASFWRALGKGLGWSMDAHNTDGHLCIKCDALGWKRYWHSMIDNLAKGGTITEFFETLE